MADIPNAHSRTQLMYRVEAFVGTRAMKLTTNDVSYIRRQLRRHMQAPSSREETSWHTTLDRHLTTALTTGRTTFTGHSNRPCLITATVIDD